MKYTKPLKDDAAQQRGTAIQKEKEKFEKGVDGKSTNMTNKLTAMMD